jgi:hypothetical protein
MGAEPWDWRTTEPITIPGSRSPISRISPDVVILSRGVYLSRGSSHFSSYKQLRSGSSTVWCYDDSRRKR